MQTTFESVCEHLRDACRRELENGNEVLRIDEPAGTQCPLVVFRYKLTIIGTLETGDLDSRVRHWESRAPHYELRLDYSAPFTNMRCPVQPSIVGKVARTEIAVECRKSVSVR